MAQVEDDWGKFTGERIERKNGISRYEKNQQV